MKIVLIKVFFILFFFANFAIAQNWHGAYAGSNIPGKQITKTFLVYNWGFYAPTADFNMTKEIEYLRKECTKSSGVALINLKCEIATGSASERNESGGGVSTYTPAITFAIFGDCVTGLK